MKLKILLSTVAATAVLACLTIDAQAQTHASSTLKVPPQAIDPAVMVNDAAINKTLRGDLKGAEAGFSQAIQMNPKYVQAYFNRALTRDQLKDYAGAIADYSQAMVVNADSVGVSYMNRGIAKGHMGDYKGAVSDFTMAIASDKLPPEILPHVYYNRGVSKQSLKDHSGAMADFRQAHVLNPSIEIPQ